MNTLSTTYKFILKFTNRLPRNRFSLGVSSIALLSHFSINTISLLVSTNAYADVWPDPICLDISKTLVEIDQNAETKLLDYEKDNLDTYRHLLSNPSDKVYMLPSHFSEYIGYKSIFFPSRQCTDGCIGKAIENNGERSSITDINYVSHVVGEIYLWPDPKEIYGQSAMVFLNINKESFVYFAASPADHTKAFTIFKRFEQLPAVILNEYKECLLNDAGNPGMPPESLKNRQR